MKNIFRQFFERWRRAALRRGYACDQCGKELFDYPVHRFCAECEAGLLVPELPCPKCGRACRAEGICLDCKSLPPSFTKGISPFVYKGNAAMIVNRLKNGYPRLAAYFGERIGETFLARCGGEIEGEPLLLVAVPMTKEKKIERGYNQAERIAESVREYLTARGVEVEMDFSVLEKTKETKQQKQMSQRERAENVAGSFFVRKRKACKGKTALLVDDILTTGATGNECAKRLLGADAAKVYFLTATAVEESK